MKTASAAEAGASARRKTPFLSARAKAAEAAGANAALAARLDIAAGGPAVAPEGLGRSFGAVVSATCASTLPAGSLWGSFGTVVNSPCAFAVPA